MREYKTILVVDDNEINRILPGLILRPFGFSIYECQNGFEAVQVIKKIPISAVLLDISMPGMSGLEVLKVIRGNTEIDHPTVIAYTSTSSDVETEELLAHGFDAVLLKPITSEKLLSILKSKNTE